MQESGMKTYVYVKEITVPPLEFHLLGHLLLLVVPLLWELLQPPPETQYIPSTVN